MPPLGNAVTVTPRSRPSSRCSMEVACCRDDSRVFIVVAEAGGSVGEGCGSGTPGYERWQASTAPMTATDDRTRIGTSSLGPPCYGQYAESEDRARMVHCPGAEDRRREIGPVRRIGKVLRLEAEPPPAPVARVQLHAGFCRLDRERATRCRVDHPGASAQHEIVVVLTRAPRTDRRGRAKVEIGPSNRHDLARGNQVLVDQRDRIRIDL